MPILVRAFPRCLLFRELVCGVAFVSGDRSLVTANSSSYTCYSMWTEPRNTCRCRFLTGFGDTSQQCILFYTVAFIEQLYFYCVYFLRYPALFPHYVFCNRSTCIMVTLPLSRNFGNVKISEKKQPTHNKNLRVYLPHN